MIPHLTQKQKELLIVLIVFHPFRAGDSPGFSPDDRLFKKEGGSSCFNLAYVHGIYS